MKVITEAGTLDLGTTEVQPTIGITDYSRRVTDDFGITTVVERGFARRMSVRFALPFEQVDQVQQQLADLRATPAQWIADDRFAWLNVTGFYKDFALDLAVPPLSYCTLTVEGLAETEAAADPGGDPAPIGSASTLRLLQPTEVTGAVLTASDVPENDHPEWSAVAVYAAGARVIKAATHRIYESLGNGNSGNDPAALTGHWIEAGPTNRWAMFDQALGTLTTANTAITVTLAAGNGDALALLDVAGTLVRVTATGYDRSMAVRPGAMTFTDLPAGAAVTVRVTGSGAVSLGTLLIGRMVMLGVTEAAPTAGINDFSRKEFDDFGEPVVVPRAWSKTMQAKALIRTDALDLVANRIAAVRARPSLWIGDEGLDSLTVYGFFKDFGIEVGENVSTLSLAIEGLAEAAPIVSLPDLIPPPNWTDVVDNDPVDRPRPQDGADITGENTSKDTAAVGGKAADQLLQDLAQLDNDTAAALAKAAELEEQAGTIIADVTQAKADILANGQNITSITETLGEQGAYLQETRTVADNAAGQLVQIEQDLSTASANASQALSASESTAGQLAQFETDLSAASANASNALTAANNAQGAVASFEQDLSTVGANVTTNANAITTLNGSVGQLKTQVRTGGGNLLTNSEFEGGLAGWTQVETLPASTVVTFSRNSHTAFRIPNTNNASIIQYSSETSGYAQLVQTVPVEGGKWYDFSCWYSNQRCEVQFFVEYLNDVGSVVDSIASSRLVAGGGTEFSDWRRVSLKRQAPSTASQARIYLRKLSTLTGADSLAWFMKPQLVETTADASSPVAYSAGNSRASVETIQTSVDGIFAQYVLSVGVNGKVGGMKLANNGETVGLTFDADYVGFETGNGRGVQIYSGLLWNRGATISTILGEDIGTDSDLVFWIGPNPTSPGAASKDAALMYVSEAGDAYWGGATVNSDTASGYFYNDFLTASDVVMGKTMRVVPNGTSLVLMLQPKFYWEAQTSGVTSAFYRIQASYDNGATWSDVTGERTINSTFGQIGGSKEEGVTRIGHSGFPAKRPILYRAIARKTNNAATGSLEIRFSTQ